MIERKRKKRICISVDEDLYADLDIMSKENEHSVSKMSEILLKSAIKERKRKRKNGKEGGSPDNS